VPRLKFISQCAAPFHIFDIHSHRRFLVLDYFAPGRKYIFRPVLRGNEGGTYWRMAAL
jgi:hypothetical protein